MRPAPKAEPFDVAAFRDGVKAALDQAEVLVDLVTTAAALRLRNHSRKLDDAAQDVLSARTDLHLALSRLTRLVRAEGAVVSPEARAAKIDAMTEAALKLDQKQFAAWWRERAWNTEDRGSIEAAWRRAYYVGVVAGALLPILEKGGTT